MAKVTSKLQVTIPKQLARAYRIAPGDEIQWEAAGEVIRVVPAERSRESIAVEDRLRLFDQASERQQRRERSGARRAPGRKRGWRREDLSRVPALVDTNVLVYRYDPRFPKKQRVATELLRKGISEDSLRVPHQAILEFVAAVTRPLRQGGPLLGPHDARREAEETAASTAR